MTTINAGSRLGNWHESCEWNGDIQKAAGPNKTWLGWQRDLELAKHYMPKVTQAFHDGMAAVREFLNKLFSGQIRVTATWAAQEIRNIMAAAMRRVFGPLWTEGYALGRASSLHATTGLLDWGGWEPGDVDAAALVADGPGLKRLLEQWGINVIQSISETRMDDLAQQIAQALVDGDSPDTLAHNIEDMLNVPRRARMIAQTELARAVTVATLDTYNETGVERKEWLVAPDERVCSVCRAAEAEGAIPLTQAFISTNKDGPPAHPHCRCVALPADTHGFDLSDMVSEPLPDFATVPLVPAMVKRFSPTELRDARGRWSRDGGNLIHGWIDISKIPTNVGIGMTDEQADDIAAKMTAGKSPGNSKLGANVKYGIEQWSAGHTTNAIDPVSLAQFKLVVHHARPAAPMLYRGVFNNWNYHSDYVTQLAKAKPGDIIKSDRAASWSEKEKVAHEFSGINESDGQLWPHTEGVQIRTQPGARAVPISKYAYESYRYQKEWVSPPSSYEVISNEEHPTIKGLRVITVKEASSYDGN